MQTRSWDGTDGQKKYRTEIVADRVQFGNRPSANGAGASVKENPADSSKDQAPAPVDTIEYPEEEINPDDIPF
jgi:single-strand DNA-binding protein